jgi:fructose-1,6-bisphosphatase/inositol monophosphatase family enzyme
MSLVDPQRLVAALELVAAEEITPRFRNLQAADITDKGGGDFVTRADEEAERRLTQILSDLLPGSVVVGEEAAHADPAVIARIAESAPVWIIDPVDGTNNFARGSDLFATMAALVVGGESVLGAVHMPTRGETTLAELGSGAFIGARRLKTAAPRAAAALRASVHTQYLPATIQPHMRAIAATYGTNDEIYCAGRVYVALAEGALDGALFWRTKPWDHAMGTLILREAGGVDGFADGTAYRPTDQDRYGLIAASAPETWRLMRDGLFPD